MELENVQYVSNTELEVQLIRPFQSDELPNAAGEEVAIRVRLPTGTPSSPHMVVLDTFRMVVLGDSAQWGQGLQEHQKVHSLVEDEIKRRVGDIGVYKKVLAHSGAIIGADQTPTVPPIPGEFGGEVNVSNPTIREQVLAALGTQASDETVDLVLVNGGINDVGVGKILNPLNDNLSEQIDNYCYGRMKALLISVAGRFPNAQIITSGYYRIVSSSSDTTFIPLILGAYGLIFVGVGVGVGVGLAVQAALRDRSLQFRDEAHQQIRRAIADAMTEAPGAAGRISFADPQFTDDEAIFAPNAKLFGINSDLSPQDNDLVAEGRRQACEAFRPDDWKCPIASIGHPNPAGAHKIASAVIAQLQVGRSQDAVSDERSEWFRGSDVRQVTRISTHSKTGRSVEYGVINGRAIFEGDIHLGPAVQLDEAPLFDNSMIPLSGKAYDNNNIIVGERFRWPDGVIPYQIDPAHPDPQLILRAINHVEQYTSLSFPVVTSANRDQYPDFVRFVSDDGCWSSVGRQGGMQEISVVPDCGFGSAVHEIGHAAGLWHQQSREDRDKHVRILWQNILPGMEFNFDQHITDGEDVGEYDTGSIMHYGSYAFSSNGQPTIQSLDNSAIGQRSGLSAGDVAGIESMYGERPITQAKPGVQLTAVVPAGATRRWFSGGWSADRNVNWQIVTATQQYCQPPLLSWTLHADRQAPGLVRYCLEVENLCSIDVPFEWRYGLLGQNGNGKGTYDAMMDNSPVEDQPRPLTDDRWATAIDAGGPPAWLLPGRQDVTEGNGSEYVDTGSPAVMLDPVSILKQNQPNQEPVGLHDQGETNDQ